MIVRGLTALIALLLLLAGIQPASTHATLISADPRDGAMLAAPPSELVLTFNEPVAPLVFTLLAPDGASDTPKVEAAERVVRLRPSRPLADGTSILSWRVVSADGHPVAGSTTFSVRVRTTNAAADATAQSPSLRAAIWVSRVLTYTGLFFGIGGVFFLCWSGTKIDFRRGSAVALAVGFAALVVSLGLVGTDALGRPLSELFAGEVWRAGYTTSFGLTASIAALGFAIAFVALLAEHRRFQRIASAAAMICAALGLASSGHASAAPPQALMRPSVFIHAAAVALWAGSLVPLLLSLGTKMRGTTALRRFSEVAPYVVAALVASGVVLAIVQIARPAALWDSSYGQVFLLKLAAVFAIVPLAVFNRIVLTRRVVRGGNRNARRQMRVTITAELALALIIFGIVALWRFTPPPRALTPSQSAFVHLHSDTMMANVTLSGPTNEMRVQLAQSDFSPLVAKEVTVRLSNQTVGIEPITRKATQTDSDWLVAGLVLPNTSGWTVEVDALITDFDKLSIKGPLVFGPVSAPREDNAFVHIHGVYGMADVTVAPGRAGAVRITLRLSREDFSPLETRWVALTLTQPGRDDLDLPVRPGVEPGEWRAGPTTLPAGGIWTIKINVTLASGAAELLDGPIVLEPRPAQ